MRRHLTLFASILVPVAAACGGGTVLIGPAGGDGGSAPSSEAGAAEGSVAAVVDPFAGAPAYVSGMMGASSHNPGTSCNDHHHNFIIGGTVYLDYKGTMPAAGVEVRVMDGSGHAASAYSGANGNFSLDTSSGVTLPAYVGARDGTTTRPMIELLQNDGPPNMGSCSRTGCHTDGGSPSMGDYYPIHVP